MPTTRKRISRQRGTIAQTNLSEESIEFLMTGDVMLTGFNHQFKDTAEIEKAYRQNRSYLFSLIGTACPWGLRPWGWWEFEWQGPGPHENNYLHFRRFFRDGKRAECFLWLESQSLLLPGEEQAFIKQEEAHQALKRRLRSNNSDKTDEKLK